MGYRRLSLVKVAELKRRAIKEAQELREAKELAKQREKEKEARRRAAMALKKKKKKKPKPKPKKVAANKIKPRKITLEEYRALPYSRYGKIIAKKPNFWCRVCGENVVTNVKYIGSPDFRGICEGCIRGGAKHLPTTVYEIQRTGIITFPPILPPKEKEGSGSRVKHTVTRKCLKCGLEFRYTTLEKRFLCEVCAKENAQISLEEDNYAARF